MYFCTIAFALVSLRIAKIMFKDLTYILFKDLSTTFKYSTAVVLEMIYSFERCILIQSQPVNFCQILDVAPTFVEETD